MTTEQIEAIKSLGPIQVLVLDDSKETLELIRRKLINMPNLSFQLFDNKDDFTKVVSDNSIHVIVIDHYLHIGGGAILTGLDMVKMIKSTHRENYVIGFSGLSDSKILIEYINSAIDFFIDKNDQNHLKLLIAAILAGVVKTQKRMDFLHYFESEHRRMQLNFEV